MILYPVGLRRMEATPNTTSGFCGADDCLPLERYYLRTRRIEEELNLLFNLCNLIALETNNLVPIIH